MPVMEIEERHRDGDLYIVGIETDGAVIFFEEGPPNSTTTYTSGETLTQYGPINLRWEEIEGLLELEGLRLEDQALLIEAKRAYLAANGIPIEEGHKS